MGWIACPNAQCGERFALEDDTEAFARAHEGIRLVCPFGHAIWPFPTAVKVPEAAPSPAAISDSPRLSARDAKASVERKRAARAAKGEPEEPVKETAEIEHVEADVSGNAAIPDEPPHAPPGAVYLLASDRPNAQGRQVTYRDGQPFSSVMNPEVSKIPVYPQHSPELPYANAEEYGARPTETGSAPPAEPEPATSEPVPPASDGPSPPADDDVPDELALYGDEIENCGSWSEVLAVVKTFYGSAFYAGLPLEKQNLIRGRTWLNLKEIGNFPMPDPVADVSAFRLFLEAERDPEAISGSFAFLQKDPDSRWDRISEDAKATVRKAVDARLKVLGSWPKMIRARQECRR